ncbi:hypothetical protein HMPREF1317_1351 [Schaalia georgiae F0490]|uniref:Uncharacterized protein n=1 Tax=Schaalia georgiae F0490 TaxID=1125717 RepID=J1HTQ6_9ACTO|nr:hypothetical protein HMPREF1317_1351 [Schaalia georgiae F0490]
MQHGGKRTPSPRRRRGGRPPGAYGRRVAGGGHTVAGRAFSPCAWTARDAGVGLEACIL